MKTSHSFPIRVYYEDTDTAGVVYYANYLKFAERARTEALRLSGIEQSDLLSEHKISFVVRRCIIDFLKPAKLDDLLTVETGLTEINKISMTMHQEIKLGRKTLVTLEVKLAVVDDNMKLAKLPDLVRNAVLKVFSR